VFAACFFCFFMYLFHVFFVVTAVKSCTELCLTKDL